MRSLQPTLKNGRNVWDPATLPESEFRQRLERVRAGMARDGIDLLLVYGRAFDDKADPCYLSNYVIRLPKSTLMAVPAEGPPALFFEGGSRGLPSMRKTTWVEDLRAAGNVVKALEGYLGERARPARVGLAGARQRMPHGQYRALAALLEGVDVVDATGLLVELRAVKSERELERVRHAGAIVRAMFERLAGAPFDSDDAASIEAVVRREARLRGAEDVRTMIGRLDAGELGMRPPLHEPLPSGARLAIWFAVEYERYWAAAARTVAFDGHAFTVAGEGDPMLAEIRPLVAPGRGLAELIGGIDGCLERHGLVRIADYGPGQGIGLSLCEAPFPGDAAAGELRAGHCLALEIAARGDDAGIFVGDTIVVTADGGEVVT